MKEERPLLDWLLRLHPNTPKTRAKQWILAGRVSVGGAVLRKPHQPVPDPGQTLLLLDRQATTLDCGSGLQIHPRVELLHVDTALAVVNKGAGLLSVPAPKSQLSALSILAQFLTDRTLPPAYRKLEPLPVHRIDQYTTGLFCLALNPKARGHLIEQLKAHTMKREYMAFAEGRAPTPSGTWKHWVALSADEMRQHIVSSRTPNSMEAVTHYEVVAEYPLRNGRGCITQLRLQLETGRKHQIRVQAAHSGMPLVGDRAYNPNNRPPIPFPRQALHAELLTLEHPQKPGQRMTWRAALPKDLRQLESLLRAREV